MARKWDDEPYWLSDPPLDGDRPILAQWEERLMELDDNEFKAGLDWLNKNIYQNPEIRSLLENISLFDAKVEWVTVH